MNMMDFNKNIAAVPVNHVSGSSVVSICIIIAIIIAIIINVIIIAPPDTV